VKIKTAELEGIALDWLVWCCAGGAVAYPALQGAKFVRAWRGNSAKYVHPSTEWDQGGPMIDRFGISVQKFDGSGPPERMWNAYMHEPPLRGEDEIVGPTPLVAVCRCYVADMLGHEVEVPEDILS